MKRQSATWRAKRLQQAAEALGISPQRMRAYLTAQLEMLKLERLPKPSGGQIQ